MCLNPDAKPKQPSFQDNSGYKVRYRYKEVVKSTDSRRFCSSMMNFSNKGLVFRIEDINMMSFRGVNKQHGHKGRNYSLLKWQGGVNCKHVFERVVYAKRIECQRIRLLVKDLLLLIIQTR